jgi:NitT/TauT family transport system permease protein
MTKIINLHPSQSARYLLHALPFVVIFVVYFIASAERISANPEDKLLPSFTQMADSFWRLLMEPSDRNGEYLLLSDTLSSLRRLFLGVGLSAISGLTLGVAMGAIPYVRAKLSPLVTAISLIPPMAILPILLITFGLGELAKIMLITIGIFPTIAREVLLRVGEIPEEQIIKAQTLGANSWQLILRIILPQIMPRLIDSIRLTLGAAWLFLIAAEAISATEGLGYRIFLMRRYLAMDVILPYVAWITILAFLIDYLLLKFSKWQFAWFYMQSSRRDV